MLKPPVRTREAVYIGKAFLLEQWDDVELEALFQDIVARKARKTYQSTD